MAQPESIAVIGSGVGGLAFAYYVQQDFPTAQIEIFEKGNEAGGLAAPFSIQGELLEKFYHHIFTTDTDIQRLIHDIGLEKKLRWYEDTSAIYYKGKLYSFMGAMDLLRFSPLPFPDRIRLGVTILFLTQTRNWKRLEKYKAIDWMRKYSGKQATDVFTKPLLYGKFQNGYSTVSMSWLWSRLKTRTNSKGKLGYLDGSFGLVFSTLQKEIEKKKGLFHFSCTVQSIIKKGKRIEIAYLDKDGKQETKSFDKVIITAPSQVYTKLVSGLGKKYISRVTHNQYISAQTIILVLKKQLTPYYWISINDTHAPALAIIEQTNMKKGYRGKHIVYIGNYLQNDSPVLSMDEKALKERYFPFLKKLNHSFDTSWVEEMYVFRAPFAQPVVDTAYHSYIPEFQSPVENIYILNMAQVYPEDRGMNFAVQKALALKNHIWTH